jgi:predicted  nucleic acid-binding Zn-ribbon protein
VNPDLRNLIALQDIEQKIAGLQKEISEVPTRLQGLQQQLEELTRAHEQRVAHCAELSKRRRTLEGDVDLLRARLSKLKDQLMAVKTNKEYTAMLHEIQAVETQIRSEEDNVLDIMEEMESLEGDLKGAERQLQVRTEQVQQTIRQCQESVPGLESQLLRLGEEKTATEALLQTDLLSRYRRIADARRGIALAEAKDELCGACHVRIRPQVYANLFKNEALYFCDSCSRILFLRDSLS